MSQSQDALWRKRREAQAKLIAKEREEAAKSSALTGTAQGRKQAKADQAQLREDRRRIKEATEHRNVLASMQAGVYGNESKYLTQHRRRMDEQQVLMAETELWDRLDRMEMKRREEDNVMLKKMEIEKRMAVNIPPPRPAIGLKPKVDHIDHSIYKKKLDAKGRPYFNADSEAQDSALESVELLTGDGFDPEGCPAVEPGKENISWVPETQQPKPPLSLKVKLLAAFGVVFFLGIIAAWMFGPDSEIDLGPGPAPAPPISPDSPEAQFRLKIGYDVLGPRLGSFKREFATDIANALRYSSPDRVEIRMVESEISSQSALLGHADSDEPKNVLLSHMDAMGEGSSFYDPKKGTKVSFLIKGSPNEDIEGTPTQGLLNLTVMFDDERSQLYTGKWTDRIGGMLILDEMKGCMSGCVPVCNGHGKMLDSGQCECEYFYSVGSVDCRTPCSNRGDVRQEGCVCLPNVKGAICETLCSDHGTWNANTYQCTCQSPPWTGVSCETPCTGQGNLSADALSCECFDKFSGGVCEIECLGRGKRSGPLHSGTCKCDFPYSGDNCEIECNGKGTSISPISFTLSGNADPFCANQALQRCPVTTPCSCFESLGYVNELNEFGGQTAQQILDGLSCLVDKCASTRSQCASKFFREDLASASTDGTTWTCLCGECLNGFTGTLGHSVDTCTAICGDGMLLGTEACDDNNLVNGDGCSNTCSIEQGYYCTGISGGTSTCATTTCGDGLRQGDAWTEACDDGNIANGDGCNSTCGIEIGFACLNPYPATVQSVCDECGNGHFLLGSEQCDDNNVINGDGCSSSCTVEAGYTCTTPSSTIDITAFNSTCSIL